MNYESRLKENSSNDGYPSDKFAARVVKGLERGDLEVSYSYAEVKRKASREELNEFFKKMNTNETDTAQKIL